MFYREKRHDESFACIAWKPGYKKAKGVFFEPVALRREIRCTNMLYKKMNGAFYEISIFMLSKMNYMCKGQEIAGRRQYRIRIQKY